MKTKSIFIIILLLMMTGFDSISQTDNPINHKQSKKLIDRFNTLRAKDNLESIQQDTVLDNICKILLTDNRNNSQLVLLQEHFPQSYRKSTGVYDEDSVRFLLRECGIIDYHYEIQEASDKDTAAVFNSFLLADKSNHLRMGYYRNGNRQILFKTKSYLKYSHGTWKEWCDPIVMPMGVPLDSMEFSSYKNGQDSIVYHFKILIPDQYYYQFYEKFPLSSEKGGNIKKKKVQMTRGVSMFGTDYDFTTTSMGKETNMWLIISNKKNERVAILK